MAKILVVDDEKEVVSLLSDVLKRANYEVISTTKGKEAVDLVLGLRPDLIILDIVMPDMDGSEIAAVLKENSSTTDIPIIYLTGILNKEEEESVDGKSGKHYIVAKPVAIEELLLVVKKALSGR